MSEFEVQLPDLSAARLFLFSGLGRRAWGSGVPSWDLQGFLWLLTVSACGGFRA